MIASIWLVAIYNCCSNILRSGEERYQKAFFTTLWFNMLKLSRKPEISLRFLQNMFIYLHTIASIWLLGIYNCGSKILTRWEEWCQKVFSLLCYSTCSKLVNNLNFLCNCVNISQNLDIYLYMITSILLLGIYNCCSNILRSWEEWYQKGFFTTL